MPGLSRKSLHFSPSSCKEPTTDARNAICNRSDRDEVNFLELRKFWTQLPFSARRELLRIDKVTLFERVRKNFYCSRCHGLLVEGFSQIVLYGKSQAGDQVRKCTTNQACCKKYLMESNFGASSITFDDTKDPSVHPWGGLSVTRDSMLTVMDCFLDGMPLEVLQNVFQSAHARERERELLYPDACGGCARGWISYSVNGRAHGMKETCALHNARLACEALVDFWSALGEETRCSLLRMKEEDFIERLIFRFDSKRFCRDCRRNVLREFKQMKELKRTHKEPKCTRWFCSSDTVFRYEVSNTTVQVEWRDCFPGETKSLYRNFEWAIGSAEGRSDIFGFEDIGLSESVTMDGLDLRNFTDCFVTVRAWRRDGRCTELCAKAHAVKGELCVHRRLFVGDGYVSISKGDNIQRFFEQAEETEEEEDDVSLDKDGNEIDEGSRPQKHAKSPELARDFLLDASTVIFKEQVEKAFREGTARQNAHSIFVCLALSLLEERVWIACQEITTLEKQNKLLEEEEMEKLKEKERREHKKKKEKEKRQRRKENLRNKDRNKSSEVVTGNLSMSDDLSFVATEEEKSCSNNLEKVYTNDDNLSVRSSSTDVTEIQLSTDGFESDDAREVKNKTLTETENLGVLHFKDSNRGSMLEQPKSAKRRLLNKLESTNVTSRFSRTIAEPFERSRRAHLRAAPAAFASLSQPEDNVHRPSLCVKTDRSKPERACTSKRLESWNSAANSSKNWSGPQHCLCRNLQSSFARTNFEKNISAHEGNKPLSTTPNGHLSLLKNDHIKSGQRTVSPCTTGNEENDFQTCIEPKAQVAMDKNCNKRPNSCENSFTSTAASNHKYTSHSSEDGGFDGNLTVSRDYKNEFTGKESARGFAVHEVITEIDLLHFGVASASSELISPPTVQEETDPVSSLEPRSDALNSSSENGCAAKTSSFISSKSSNQKLGDPSLQADVICNGDISSKQESGVASCSFTLSGNGCSGDKLKEIIPVQHTVQMVSQLEVISMQKSIGVDGIPTYLHCSDSLISGQDPASIQPSKTDKRCHISAPQREMYHPLQTSRSVLNSMPSSVIHQESYAPAYPSDASSISPIPCRSMRLSVRDPKSVSPCNTTEAVRSSYHPIYQSSHGVILTSEQSLNELVPSESLVLPGSKKADSLGVLSDSENSEFSLFHFGGPTSTNLGTQSLVTANFIDETAFRDLLDMGNCKISADQPREANKAKGADEYSLFAAAPWNVFGLF